MLDKDVIELLDNAPRITKAKQARQVMQSWSALKHPSPIYDALAFDTETTGVEFGQPQVLKYGTTHIYLRDVCAFGISLAIPAFNHINLVWARIGTLLFENVVKFLLVCGPKVAHNLKYDLRVLKTTCQTQVAPSNRCTLAMARMLWNRRMKFGLKDLASVIYGDFFDWDAELKAVVRNLKSAHTRAGFPKGFVNYSFIPDEIIKEYAMIDAFSTYMLNFKMREAVDRDLHEVCTREHKTIHIVKKIEERGMCFSPYQAEIEIKKIRPKIPKAERKLFRLVNEEFNPRSHKQLKKIFLVNLDVPKRWMIYKKKVSTNYKYVLTKILTKNITYKTRTFIKTLKELRRYEKLINTYLVPLRKRALNNNWSISCSINTTDTRTGRMAVTAPALQTIPRPALGSNDYNPVRKCFVPRKGFRLFLCDYSQVEMWIFAVTANEQSMIDAFINGLDIHQFVADDIGCTRQKAKGVNFGIIYGMGAQTLAEQIESQSFEARRLLNDYLKKYPGVKRLRNDCAKSLRTDGFITDLFGRRYNLSVRDAYKGPNCLVQGGCAQILKQTMIEVNKYLKTVNKHLGYNKIRMIMPIHDELIFEVPKDLPDQIEIMQEIQEIMEDVPQLRKFGLQLPTKLTHSDTSWEDKKSIEELEAV